jgi:two-component system, NtrC family, response regulator GlrR
MVHDARAPRSPADERGPDDGASGPAESPVRSGELPGTTESIAESGAAAVAVQRFRLIVQRGPNAGTTFVSARERTVVGTHESCDLVLTDPKVSRFHCEIAVEGRRLAVRDFNSRNGTVVNGVPVGQAWLPPAAVVTVGHTELRLELRSDPVRLPVSDERRFGGLVGGSTEMRRVFALLERAP